MLSTKTKEHIRRRAALWLPRWGTLLASLGALAGCVAFTGSQLHVVKITDTHGAQGMAITSAHDIKTLMQQAGIAAPDTEDELEITENAGLDQIHILRAYTVPVTVDGGVQEVVVTPAAPWEMFWRKPALPLAQMTGLSLRWIPRPRKTPW